MRHRTLVLSLAGAALFACAGLARAQAPQLTPEQLQARADACVPPPCHAPTAYPPCEKPEMQHQMAGVSVMELKVADGPEVRPLGGAAPPLPEVSICVAVESGEEFLLYLPSIDEPLIRIGMLNALNVAMQTRTPIDLQYGLPNGALRKVEGVSFGAPVAVEAAVKCGYGDFERCDTGWEAAGGEKARDVGRILRMHFIGYGKNSRAVQVFLDGKAPKSFLIDPSASPERFLLLMNFAATAQIAGVPVEIVSVPGKAPEEATDKSVAPPIALDISPAAMR